MAPAATSRSDDAAVATLRALASTVGCAAADGQRALAVLDLAGAVFVVDAMQRIVHISTTAAEIAGVQPADALGQHCRDVFRCITCVNPCQLLSEGRIRSRRLALRAADGRVMDVVKNGTALLDESGKVVGGFEVILELTSSSTAQRHSDADECPGDPDAHRPAESRAHGPPSRLRTARESRQLTLRQLRDATGIGLGRLSMIERCMVVPKRVEAERLAAAVQAAAEDLFPDLPRGR